MSNLNTRLDDAINRGNLAEVISLIQLGADLEYIDEFGNTPLQNAAWIASTEIVEYLLSVGANVYHKNKQEKTALEMLQSIGHNNYGHDAVIKILNG